MRQAGLVVQLVKCVLSLQEVLGFRSPALPKLGMVMQACPGNIYGVEARGLPPHTHTQESYYSAVYSALENFLVNYTIVLFEEEYWHCQNVCPENPGCKHAECIDLYLLQAKSHKLFAETVLRFHGSGLSSS